MFKNNFSKLTAFLLFVVVLLLLLRFFLLGSIVPLMDKTESRYAEIARLMVETNDWLALYVDYDFPFWAKPPLSTWLTALSFKTFGINEFWARFPSYMVHVLLLLILGLKTKKMGTPFWLPAFILLTTPEFLLHTGVVSTDTFLGFCVVLAMLSFWEAMHKDRVTIWNYLFFIMLGLGLLAKGPLIFVFTIPVITSWMIIHKIKLQILLKKFPWAIGSLLILLIAFPWYILMEQRSPGFLNYFIIGEHFERFLYPTWGGDLYGQPKSFPPGMIWIFLMLFAFPWVQFVLYKCWTLKKTIFSDKWISYLVLWFIWIPLFFTFSNNINHTYILPAAVPIALLAIQWWKDIKNSKPWLAIASVLPMLVVIGTVFLLLYPKASFYMNTDKYLIKHIKEEAKNDEIKLFYWEFKSYSGQFYLGQKTYAVGDETALDSILQKQNKIQIFIPNKKLADFPKQYKARLKLMDSNYRTSVYLLK